jgi:hypothetical protein
MTRVRDAAVGCLVGVALAALLSPAVGQITSKSTNSGGATKAKGTVQTPSGFEIPVGNLPGGNQNLTPEQIQSIMLYRALQARGGGQVRRGVPQFIPLGVPGMLPYPQANGTADPQADTGRKRSLEKRIEARKAAEEKKRAAREAKKAKQKDAAAKKAKLRKQAADPAAPDIKAAK